MLNGDADLPHRSLSPLKRRASTMNPDKDGDAAHQGGEEIKTPNGVDTGSDTATGDPREMSLDPPDYDDSQQAHASSDVKPPLLEQVKVIETVLKAFAETPIQEGNQAYVVSRTWVNKALSLRSDPKLAEAGEPLGAIDNSDIIEDVIKQSDGQMFTQLKPGTDLEHFELFPEDAWNMVMSWYGIKEGQKAIVRVAVNTSLAEPNIVYELHPPIFRIHRLWSEISPLPIEQTLKASNPPPLVLVRSRKYHTQTFFRDLKKLAGIPIDRKFRVWILPSPAATCSSSRSTVALTTPPESPDRSTGSEAAGPWAHLLVDVVAFSKTQSERRVVPAVDQTGNPKYNGSASLMMHELSTDESLVLDEAIDDVWVSTFNGRSRPAASMGANKGSAISSSRSDSGRSSPAPQGPMTRGRLQKNRKGRSLGAVGLQNLGNTCYMNSALQCVRSVEELTKYFLTDTFSSEINKTNPLGYYGKVAMAYGNLLRDIYDEGRGSVSPRDFKGTVGRCRSTFSGFGQQDSQEFLGFLLDGLQEDLSRIKKKPYIEKPDSTDEMINDPEAIRQMAEQVWDITRKRDDSVIADLFTGMYKSTLKCPECGKVSITFDPFNNLTLPLPVEDMVCRTVKFFPLNDVPVKFEVELKKHSAIEALKQFVSQRTGVPVNRLMGAEEFKGSFFKIYDNNQDASEEIGNSDIPTLHELEAEPTNFPGQPPRKYRSMLDIDATSESEWDDERYDRMVVPVFHRRPDSVSRVSEQVAPPHFIVLTRNEARNLESIRRKVLAKVATFSTWSRLTGAKNGESDVATPSASDGDSTADSRIVANSVEGEDDMVDVTMKDANEAAVTNPAQVRILRRFDTREPAFLDPKGFLDPELQNLFDLSYFTNRKELVPTGWQNLDSNRTLPKLSDRLPEPSVPEDEDDGQDDDQGTPESWNNTASGEEDSSNEGTAPSESGNTRMVDESSEDEGVQIHARADGPRGQANRGGRKKFKGHKSYGKKGNKRRDKQMRGGKQNRMQGVKPQPMPPAIPDGGPLIRMCEGLVVDWNEEAWETVFGGNAGGQASKQGSRTFTDLEKVQDQALKIHQRRRQTRRSRGITLDECLDEFERAEVLSEQDMWYCPRCKEHRRASKKFDLWKSPDILVAHLKRFSSSGWRRDKLDVLVDFPIEGLDLTERVIEKEDGKAEIYDLIAVDDHYGGLGGGHYTAYARNFADGRWYNYNDSHVSPVSDPSSAITSAAYLLFYRRRSSVPLGGSRFRQIFEKYEGHSDDEEEGDVPGNGQGHGPVYMGDSPIRPPAIARRSTRTTVTPLAGPDDDEPSMCEASGRGDSVRDSIEDEGVGMSGHYESVRSNSLDMTQGWNFNGLDDDNNTAGADNSGGSGYATTDEILDYSGSDQAESPGYFDQDTDMTSSGGGTNEQPGKEVTTGPRDTSKDSVVAISPDGKQGGDSDEVAEIHVDGEQATTAR